MRCGAKRFGHDGAATVRVFRASRNLRAVIRHMTGTTLRRRATRNPVKGAFEGKGRAERGWRQGARQGHADRLMKKGIKRSCSTAAGPVYGRSRVGSAREAGLDSRAVSYRLSAGGRWSGPES